MSNKSNNSFFDNIKKLHSNVLNFGFLSFFTQLGATFVYSTELILMLKSNNGLLSEKQLVILRNLSESFPYVFQVISGYLSDQWKDRKIFLTIGYGSMILLKIGFFICALGHYLVEIPMFKPYLTIGTFGIVYGALKIIDRFMDAIRDVNRDALIEDSIRPEEKSLARSVRKMIASPGSIIAGISVYVLIMLLKKTTYVSYTQPIVYGLSLIPLVISNIFLFRIHNIYPSKLSGGTSTFQKISDYAINSAIAYCVVYNNKPWYIKITLILLNVLSSQKKKYKYPINSLILSVVNGLSLPIAVASVLLSMLGNVFGVAANLSIIFSFLSNPLSHFMLLYNGIVGMVGLVNCKGLPIELIGANLLPIFMKYFLNFMLQRPDCWLINVFSVLLGVFFRQLSSVSINLENVTSMFLTSSDNKKHTLLKKIAYSLLSLLGLIPVYYLGLPAFIIYVFSSLLCYGSSLVFWLFSGFFLLFGLKSLDIVSILSLGGVVKLALASVLYNLIIVLYGNEMNLVQVAFGLLAIAPLYSIKLIIVPLIAMGVYHKMLYGKINWNNMLYLLTPYLVMYVNDNLYVKLGISIIGLLVFAYQYISYYRSFNINFFRKSGVFAVVYGLIMLLHNNHYIAGSGALISAMVNENIVETGPIQKLLKHNLYPFIYNLLICVFIGLGTVNKTFFFNLGKAIGMAGETTILLFILVYIGIFLSSLVMSKYSKYTKSLAIISLVCHIASHLLPALLPNKLILLLSLLLLSVSISGSFSVFPTMVSKSLDNHEIKGTVISIYYFVLGLVKVFVAFLTINLMKVGVRADESIMAIGYQNVLLKTAVFPAIALVLYLVKVSCQKKSHQ